MRLDSARQGAKVETCSGFFDQFEVKLPAEFLDVRMEIAVKGDAVPPHAPMLR